MLRPVHHVRANEKFGVIFTSHIFLPVASRSSGKEGVLLPVRAWRGSRLQLASEKQDSPGKGSLLVDHRTLLLRGRELWQMMLGGLFRRGCSYGRAVAKIVCAIIWYDTLVQYAACSSFAFLLCSFGPQGWEGEGEGGRWAQFDSDYSGGDGASLFFSGESQYAEARNWILLTVERMQRFEPVHVLTANRPSLEFNRPLG